VAQVFLKTDGDIREVLRAILTSPEFYSAAVFRAKVKSPHRIVLTFSEALEPAFSGALLLDQDGRNLNGEPVKVSGRLITITPERLEPGRYIVSWHSAGHEGKRLEGRVRFTVRP